MLFCGSSWPPPSIAAMHGGSRRGPCPSRRRARPRLAWAFIAANLPRLSQAAALRCGAGSLPIYGCALQLSLPSARPSSRLLLVRPSSRLPSARPSSRLPPVRSSSRLPSARPSSRLAVWGGGPQPLLMAALRRRPRPLFMRRAVPAGCLLSVLFAFSAQANGRFCLYNKATYLACQGILTKKLYLPLNAVPAPIPPALHCSTLHCTALFCAALLYSALHCSALLCTVLLCTAPLCSALHHSVLLCSALRCSALHRSALLCTVLLRSALHCSRALLPRPGSRALLPPAHCFRHPAACSSHPAACSAPLFAVSLRGRTPARPHRTDERTPPHTALYPQARPPPTRPMPPAHLKPPHRADRPLPARTNLPSAPRPASGIIKFRIIQFWKLFT